MSKIHNRPSRPFLSVHRQLYQIVPIQPVRIWPSSEEPAMTSRVKDMSSQLTALLLPIPSHLCPASACTPHNELLNTKKSTIPVLFNDAVCSMLWARTSTSSIFDMTRTGQKMIYWQRFTPELWGESTGVIPSWVWMLVVKYLGSPWGRLGLYECTST